MTIIYDAERTFDDELYGAWRVECVYVEIESNESKEEKERED